MSYVIAVPEVMAVASSDLSGIGEAIRAAIAEGAPSMTGIVAAAHDEVSAAIARVFGSYGDDFQSQAAQSVAFHDRFVQAFSAGAAAYERTEAASTSPLQTVENDVMGAVNAPTELLVERPLIGNGANGAAGTGQNGGAGGILEGQRR